MRSLLIQHKIQYLYIFTTPFYLAYRDKQIAKISPEHMASEAQPKTPIEAGVRRRVDQVIKSPHDERSYRALELHNGMRVLLVSDPTTDRAAASLSVRVGKLSLNANL